LIVEHVAQLLPRLLKVLEGAEDLARRVARQHLLAQSSVHLREDHLLLLSHRLLVHRLRALVHRLRALDHPRPDRRLAPAHSLRADHHLSVFRVLVFFS